MILKSILYDWGGVNSAIFHAINGTSHAVFKPLVVLGNLVGNYWGLPILLSILMVCAQVCKNRSMNGIAARLRVQTCRLFIGFLIAWLCVGLLKLGLDFPRPLTVFGSNIQVIGTPEIRHSFPSGHSAYIALVSMILWPLFPVALRSLLLGVILWVGWSRIASGAHFPADVLAGALIGLLSAWLACRVVKPLPGTAPVRRFKMAFEQTK